MTTPDYRALCAELLAAVGQLTSHGDSPAGPGHRLILTADVDELEEIATRARILLAAPEAVGVSPSEDAAFAMGQTGGQPSEAERLAFEQWMRGHSWLVSGEWNGSTYNDRPGHEGWHDNNTMITRMLWAAWRDRAVLTRYGTAHPAPVPVGERLPGVDDCLVQNTGPDGEPEWWCWFYRPGLEGTAEWRWNTTPRLSEWYGWQGVTYWLPHWALPLPTGAQP